MARPRKLNDLQLQQIKHRLAMVALNLHPAMLRLLAQVYKVSIRTLRRRLHQERHGLRGRKTKREKREELRQLRS